MTLHEALALLGIPTVQQRLHALRNQRCGVPLPTEFQDALLAAFQDDPSVQAALLVVWDHYTTLLAEASPLYRLVDPLREGYQN